MSHTNMKIWKVCNENLGENEYHLLVTCSTYKVIHEKYDDLLDGHDNVNFILRFSPIRLSTYVRALFHMEIFYYRVIIGRKSDF